MSHRLPGNARPAARAGVLTDNLSALRPPWVILPPAPARRLAAVDEEVEVIEARPDFTFLLNTLAFIGYAE